MSAFSANIGKLGQGRNFNAPAFIIAKMKVKTVHFIQSHSVEHFENGFFGLEITCHIKHKTSVSKARFVFYLTIGNGN
jgi:hypothetical protein